MSTKHINKRSIEKESLVILNELLQKYFKGREIVLGHALMTFIQYFLVMEVLHPKNFLNKIHEEIYCTRASNLNKVILSTSLSKKHQISGPVSYIKEILNFIQLNKKIKKNKILFKTVNYVDKVEPHSFSDLNNEKVQLIYSIFCQKVKLKLTYIEKILAKYLSKYPYYSGKFVYNLTILQAFQYRRNKLITSFGVQHGGHNYVSSEYNAFLYPEYSDYFIPVVAGSLSPNIHKYSHHQILTLPSNNPDSIGIKTSASVKDVSLILGFRTLKPFRIDGNPMFYECDDWNESVKNFVLRYDFYRWAIKYYPGQHKLMRPYFRNYTTIETIEECYKEYNLLICDHYGTTFLQSLRKGYLCLLLIDLTIFNIRKDIIDLISPFIIGPNTTQQEMESIYRDWYSGHLNKARNEILNKLYKSDQIF